MMKTMNFAFMMLMLSLINVMLQSVQFLMLMLSLEMVMLCMVLTMVMIMTISSMVSPSIILLLLTMGVCEASLGLTMLVIMSRKFGSDNMMLMSTLKC